MKTRLDDLRPRNTQVHQREPSRAAQDALVRLARNPQDASALVAVYDVFGNRLKASAVRWFGRDAELRSRTVLSILVAIGRQAGTYDPQSMNASEWVNKVADAEARRLREALDARLSMDPQSAIRPLGGGYSRSFGEETGQDQLGRAPGMARHKRRRRGSTK